MKQPKPVNGSVICKENRRVGNRWVQPRHVQFEVPTEYLGHRDLGIIRIYTVNDAMGVDLIAQGEGKIWGKTAIYIKVGQGKRGLRRISQRNRREIKIWFYERECFQEGSG